MNKKIYFILLALLAWSFNLKAQTAEIESITAAPGDAVSFDVTVADLPTDMGAITLFIGFDNNVLTYTGTTDGTISGYVANNMGSQIGIQWTTTDLVNGEDVNGVLLSLNFDYSNLGGMSDLTFNAGTEFTKVDLTTVTVAYTNGSIGPDAVTPTITIGDSVASAGPYSMDIGASGFGAANIGSISLRIAYDPAVVTIPASSPVTTTLSGGILVSSANNPGVLTISWINFTGTTIPDGPIFNFTISNFSGVTGSDFSFEDNFGGENEIAEAGAGNPVVSTSFNGGSITPASEAQQLTIPDITAVPGNPASFAVDASGFPSDVGAISLFINYDPACLTNPSVSDGTISGYTFNSPNPGELVLFWTQGGAGQPIDGTLVTLNFDYQFGDCEVTFSGSCEISGAGAGNPIIPTTYNNGSVTQVSGGAEARIPLKSGDVGQPIEFPVLVKDFPIGVGAISLFIGYDDGALDYTGTTDGTISGYFANELFSGLIGIQWTASDLVNGQDINPNPEDTLVMLNFTYLGGEGDITFNMGCEFVEPDLTTIPVAYFDGGVVLQTFFRIKAFLEGPFNGTDMDVNLTSYLPTTQPFSGAPWNYPGTEEADPAPADVVDWVLLDFREGTDAATATNVAYRAAFILNTGMIVDLDGTSDVAVDYVFNDDIFVAVWHRNHLAAMTSASVVQDPGDSFYNFDFTDAQSKAYNNGQKDLGGGFFGLYGGDADGNGQVQPQDKNLYWLPQFGQAGYKEGDFDLNGQVQPQDKNLIWLPNFGLGTQVP
jgi:hypothetical protein